MTYCRSRLGKRLSSNTKPAPDPAIDGSMVCQPASKADYDGTHADAVSPAAARSHAEGCAKTAQKAEELAATGASPVVDVAGNLSANVNEAALDVGPDRLLIGPQAPHNTRMIGAQHAPPHRRELQAPRWTMWVVGAVALGGIIYVMTNTNGRTRRSEE